MNIRGVLAGFNWPTFFLGNWRAIGVLILLSVIGLQHIRNQNAESKIDDLKAQSRFENAVREAQAREVKNRSDSTIRSIKNDHKTLVAQAEKNAWANFQRKRHVASGSSLGSGIRSNPVIGLRLPSANPDSGAPDSAKASNGPGEGIMAIDSGLLSTFTRDCALDALAISEWQKWATGNQLPIEK